MAAGSRLNRRIKDVQIDSTGLSQLCDQNDSNGREESCRIDEPLVGGAQQIERAPPPQIFRPPLEELDRDELEARGAGERRELTSRIRAIARRECVDDISVPGPALNFRWNSCGVIEAPIAT